MFSEILLKKNSYIEWVNQSSKSYHRPSSSLLLMLLPTLWDFNGVTVCVGFSKVFLSFDRKIAVNGEIAGLILQ